MSENTLEASRGARHGSAPGLPTTASPHTRSHTEPEALSKTRERRRCHSRYTRRSNLQELAARQVLLKRTQLLQTRPCLPHRAAGHSRYVRAKTRAKLPAPKRGRTWSPALTRAPATPRPHQPPCRPAGLPHPHRPRWRQQRRPQPEQLREPACTISLCYHQIHSTSHGARTPALCRFLQLSLEGQNTSDIFSKACQSTHEGKASELRKRGPNCQHTSSAEAAGHNLSRRARRYAKEQLSQPAQCQPHTVCPPKGGCCS